MKAMKFRVESPEHSEKIQKALFKLGYVWRIGNKAVHSIDQPYLYTEDTGYITYSSELEKDYFLLQKNVETTLEEIIPVSVAEVTKPPLGLLPRSVVKAERICDIFEAMRRYSDAEMAIPREWLDELQELVAP